jgi:hypothetical protein
MSRLPVPLWLDGAKRSGLRSWTAYSGSAMTSRQDALRRGITSRRYHHPNNDTPKIGDVRIIERNDRWDVERYGDPSDAADPGDPPEWVCPSALRYPGVGRSRSRRLPDLNLTTRTCSDATKACYKFPVGYSHNPLNMLHFVPWCSTPIVRTTLTGRRAGASLLPIMHGTSAA